MTTLSFIYSRGHILFKTTKNPEKAIRDRLHIDTYCHLIGFVRCESVKQAHAMARIKIQDIAPFRAPYDVWRQGEAIAIIDKFSTHKHWYSGDDIMSAIALDGNPKRSRGRQRRIITEDSMTHPMLGIISLIPH